MRAATIHQHMESALDSEHSLYWEENTDEETPFNMVITKNKTGEHFRAYSQQLGKENIGVGYAYFTNEDAHVVRRYCNIRNGVHLHAISSPSDNNESIEITLYIKGSMRDHPELKKVAQYLTFHPNYEEGGQFFGEYLALEIHNINGALRLMKH